MTVAFDLMDYLKDSQCLDKIFSGTPSPQGVLIGTIPAGSEVAFVLCDVVSVFDGGAYITVGDVVAEGRLMASADACLTAVNGYLASPNVVYNSDTDLYVFVQGTPARGVGRIRVFYY